MYEADYLRYEGKWIWCLNPLSAELFQANKGMCLRFISFVQIGITLGFVGDFNPNISPGHINGWWMGEWCHEPGHNWASYITMTS